MNVVGFIMAALAFVIVSGAAINRTRRLTEKQVDILAVVAIVELFLAFFSGVYLMAVS